VGFGDLIHQVVVVDESLKQVSSSKAHERVTTSLLFKGRPERAEERLSSLKSALAAKDWRQAFEITWAEFWDMHALFETSRPSFGYMTAGSLEALRIVRSLSWDAHGDGPLVTMDAGPNVHLLYRNDEAGRKFASGIANAFKGRHQVIESDGSR
jgi:diphosphomevalonate decarboxylase